MKPAPVAPIGPPGPPVPPPPATPVRRRVVSSLIGFVMKYANRSVSIKEMQKEFNAELGRICKMRISDTKQEWYFRIWDGKIEILDPTEAVVGGFEITSDTLIALALGKRKVRDPGNGAMFEVPFGPVEALTHGELRIWGDAVSNDALLFIRQIYREVAPRLAKQLRGAVNESQ